MNTLYIVASSVQRRAVRLPAAQFYVGDVFSAAITHARRFAKSESGVLVLSPRLGLLSQRYLIDPKDEADSRALDDACLIATIRGDLPHLKTPPLRIVLLASSEVVSLFREAIIGTPFERVPLREPLVKRSLAEQLRWLRSATWPVECNAALPLVPSLSMAENERLQEAVRAAATWWSEKLMFSSPPPESNLFADALAFQLHAHWCEVAATSRGEWPEDIEFSIAFPGGGTPIETALLAIGLDPRGWWKREGRSKPPLLATRFSLACVTAEHNGHSALIFQ